MLLVSSWCAAPELARAQAPTAGEVSLARQLFQQGVEAANDNRWEDARSAFARAHGLIRRPLILLNLASAQIRTGRLVEGIESYRRFLREAQTDAELAQRGAAQQALDEARARVPSVRLHVRNLADHDVLVLDGTELSHEVIDAEFPVDPGAHRVVVTRDDVEVASTSFRVAEQEVREVALEAPVYVPPMVSRRSGEVVYVDDERRERDEGSSVLESPWFWVAAGVVVGTGVVAGVLLANRDDGLLEGTIPPGRVVVR